MSPLYHFFPLVDCCQRSPNLKIFPQGVSEMSHPATDEEEEEVPSTTKKKTNSKINMTGVRKVIKHFS